MTPTSETTHVRESKWRRELVPVIAVAALAADYLSPPALWTILLPCAGVIALAALRRPAVAAIVFVLSSWVLIPSAARVVTSIEDARGEHQLLTVDGEDLLSVGLASIDPCVPRDLPEASLPVGPGHLVNPRWALRDAIVSFAEYHNAILIERAHRACRDIAFIEAAD
jgi:hypothetical protein